MANSRSRSGPKASNRRNPARETSGAGSHGLARVLSKRGLCSRSEAERWIRAGRVSVGGRVCTDPEQRTRLDESDLCVDGQLVSAAGFVYLMLYKPRGLMTTRNDERGRPTVYDAFSGVDLPWLAPVGRLDQASEGLLLFSNDSEWSAAITAPASHVAKIYHVQIDRVADENLLMVLRNGIEDRGESLVAERVIVLRAGEKTSWLEIVLTQGRNRQIRRMLSVLGVEVRRLVRVGIGDLVLGALRSGEWRHLDSGEVAKLAKRADRVASSAESAVGSKNQ